MLPKRERLRILTGMIFIGAISVDFVANLLGQREDAYLMNAPLLFLKRPLLAFS